MKTIKLYLEYQCFPMWIYDENGDLIDNDLVEEIQDNTEIDNMLVEIQDIYDGLYEDNNINFAYIGFKNETQKESFLSKINNVMNLIEASIGDQYIIENKVDI